MPVPPFKLHQICLGGVPMSLPSKCQLDTTFLYSSTETAWFKTFSFWLSLLKSLYPRQYRIMRMSSKLTQKLLSLMHSLHERYIHIFWVITTLCLSRGTRCQIYTSKADSSGDHSCMFGVIKMWNLQQSGKTFSWCFCCFPAQDPF